VPIVPLGDRSDDLVRAMTEVQIINQKPKGSPKYYYLTPQAQDILKDVIARFDIYYFDETYYFLDEKQYAIYLLTYS